jgi:hypothetical protein
LATQQAPYNSRGTVSYASISQANAYVPGIIESLANYIDDFGGSGGSAAVNFGSGRYHPNLLTLSFFAQDTFKVSPELTVNVGVRYENFGHPAFFFFHLPLPCPAAKISPQFFCRSFPRNPAQSSLGPLHTKIFPAQGTTHNPLRRNILRWNAPDSVQKWLKIVLTLSARIFCM